mgnify:CR=1 FL=1|jgi:hypothetical protein
MKYIKSTDVINSSAKAKSETNDCSVRAFATALDVSYDSAHEYVKNNFDRENKKGVHKMMTKGFKLSGKVQKVEDVEFKIDLLPSSKITNEYKLHGEVISRKKTVKSFIKDFSKGIYLVLVSGHVFTVKDGIMIDNAGEEWRPTRKVEDVFEINVKKILEQLELNLG